MLSSWGGSCDFWWRRDFIPVFLSSRPAMERRNANELYVYFNLGDTLHAVRTLTADFATCDRYHLRGCEQWSDPFDFGTPLVGGPAATWATWQDTGAVVLALRQADGTITTHVHSSIGPVIFDRLTPPVPAEGDPAFAQMGDYLYMVYRGEDGFLWQTRRAPDPWNSMEGWSTPVHVTVNGQPFLAARDHGPTLVRGYTPAVYGGYEVLYGMFVGDQSPPSSPESPCDLGQSNKDVWCDPEATGPIGIYSLASAEGAQWLDWSDYLLDGAHHYASFTPALAFSPIDVGSNDGRLFIWDNRGQGTSAVRVKAVSYNYQRGLMGPFYDGYGVLGMADNEWDSGPNRVGVGLYYDRRSVRPALRGMRTVCNAPWGKDCLPEKQPNEPATLHSDSEYWELGIYPYADGTMDLDMRDWSDFELLRVGLCRSLIKGSGGDACGTGPGAASSMCEGCCETWTGFNMLRPSECSDSQGKWVRERAGCE